ncbi:MAG: hypothetical protein FJY88_01740 [Candidatus Eisenbacteria bacterium]|nr:hypothetical protein [Candidatus Eisenbacteria bacterium]
MTLRVVSMMLLCAALGSCGEAWGDQRGESAPSPLARIETALAAGEITPAEGAFYKLLALHRSGRLPSRFAVPEAPPIKCGTLIVQEARAHLDAMSSEMRQAAAAFLVRPILDSYVDTDNFRIHYATSGLDMIYQWPNTAYRDAVVAACDSSYSYQNDRRGWPHPPSDGSNGGGIGLIDCYVEDNGGAYYGVTYAESQVPGGYPNDWTAYFCIDNDYQGFGYTDRTWPMKVTVAHEYNHVIQIGLNAGAGWWMENTATFMEDEVYDEVNDNYGYLAFYTNNPWTRLDYANGGFEYGCFLWPTFLSEAFGHSVVRDVWTAYASNTNLYTCFDNKLAAFGKNLDTAVAEWTLWNCFTSTRDDGEHYVEGGAYNRLVVQDNNILTYPQTNLHPTSGRWPQGLGMNLTRFYRQSGSTDNKILVSYQALNSCGYNHQIWFVRKLLGQPVWQIWPVAVNGTGAASFEATEWDATEYMLMAVPMKRACGTTGKDFQFSASTTYVVDVADGMRPARQVRLDQNSPNPFSPSTAISFSLPEEGPVRLQLFDVAGRRVRSLVDGILREGEHEVHWGGTDDEGSRLAQGVYLCVIEANGERIVRKMQLVD